jgi:hypothetical protein
MQLMFRFAPLLLACAGMLCACRSVPRVESVSPSPQTHSPDSSNTIAASENSYSIPDPLLALNGLFLNAYRERQAFVRTNTSPIIVADFDRLILYRNGLTETNRSIPAIYHALKTVAHVPFGIYLSVEPCTRIVAGPVSESVKNNLKSFLEKIQTVERFLPEASFSPEQIARQRSILEACEAYLTKVVSTRTASRVELLSFVHRVATLVLANADDAAAAQLDMTHAVVMKWKRRIPPEEWNRLVVVVRGPQLPRRLNILTQYFAKVLHEPGHGLGYPLESRRLIYAEFIFNNRDQLDLMASSFLDGDASEAFFGDRLRMSRDLLSEGAKKHLKEMKFD